MEQTDQHAGFTPSVWPEQEAPEAYQACGLCELNKQRKRVVWGEGNPEARLVVLLDNPGLREDAEGNPFVCGTRQTLQRAASEAGFAPDEVFVTYVLKCRPIRAYDKPVCRSACLFHLREQLAAIQPELLFCMGNAVVQAFWNDPDVEVKQLRGCLHHVQGWRTAVTWHPWPSGEGRIYTRSFSPIGSSSPIRFVKKFTQNSKRGVTPDPMTLSTLIEESKGDPLLESAYRRVIALFEDLIRQKLRVRVYYGKAMNSNLLEGIITKHDAKSGWIQVGNLRLPLDWVVKIEVVEDVPDETRQRKKRPNERHRPEHYP